MNLTTLGVIPLTLLSLLVLPHVVSLGVNPSSETLSSWTSQVQENFYTPNGSIPVFDREYDFRSYAPDFSQIINDFVDSYNNTMTTALEYLNQVQSFFRDPFNLEENDQFQGALNLLKLNKFNTLTQAQEHWDTLNSSIQLTYTQYLYPEMSFLVQWFYYSPTQLNS